MHSHAPCAEHNTRRSMDFDARPVTSVVVGYFSSGFFFGIDADAIINDTHFYFISCFP